MAGRKQQAAPAASERVLPVPVTVADEYLAAILVEMKAIRAALESR